MHLWPGLGHTLAFLGGPAEGQGDKVAGISLTLVHRWTPQMPCGGFP